MKPLQTITPYDDKDLKFDPLTERYYLTREYVNGHYEDNVIKDGVLDREIKRNTNNVYDYIFSRVNTNNVTTVKILLNRTAEGRRFILELLSYQMEANLENGFNGTGKIPLVNPANGQILPREEVKRNQVSVETERLLENSNIYLGINIFYQGTFPPYFLALYRG